VVVEVVVDVVVDVLVEVLVDVLVEVVVVEVVGDAARGNARIGRTEIGTVVSFEYSQRRSNVAANALSLSHSVDVQNNDFEVSPIDAPTFRIASASS
jgi:hypothetical protein